MADIYQEIWDADQGHHGIRALSPNETITDALRTQGYVIVDEAPTAGRTHRLLSEVVIPDSKMESYNLVARLFNNYRLDQTKPEENYPEEDQEVQDFLGAIVQSPPMEAARQYIATQANRTIGVEDWKIILQRVWFEQFDSGRNQDLSGFEHVLAGEQKGGKVQGYHFWFKYYLDEHFRHPQSSEEEDLIGFERWENTQEDVTPDVVTLSFTWKAFDYAARAFRPLTKPIGGFWVGPSAEGLMAMGTVRCLNEAHAPKQTVINGFHYNLPLYRSPNDRNLRTFYPEFKGRAVP